MYKIRTLDNISAKGLDRLPRDHYEIGPDITRPDAILLRSYNMHELDLPGSLLAVGRAGTGVNNIPVDALSARGIPVFNAPGANANAVKELVLAGLLMAARNIGPAWQYASSLEGDDAALGLAAEAGKKRFTGFELPGRTLGVVGLGAVGVLVANAARALGMRVIGFDPTITVQRAWQLSSDVEGATSIDTLLSRVDCVTFHVPLIDATRNMINAERLGRMRDGVVILNFARGGIIDDGAVVEAIAAGKVSAYVCDFPSNRLKASPRVITLPHLGASTREAEENCAVMAVEQLRDYLESGNVRNAVNFPEVQLPRAGRARLAVVNANVPDMLAKVSHYLGKRGFNIVHMVNESRASLACTLADTEQPIGGEIVQAMAEIEGVLKVRVL